LKSEKITVVLSILCFFLVNLGAINSESPQEKKGQEGIREEVTVTLKLLQLYVTDKKGNPVTDLTIDDFVLEDNGKGQTITEFERYVLPLPSEEKKVLKTEPEPAKENIMPRKFLLFFDFAFNSLDGVRMAKKAALHFINTQVVPTDDVGILSYSTHKGLLLHEYLTSDHEKIREAVNELGVRETAGRAGRLLADQENSLRFSEYQWEAGSDHPAARLFRQQMKKQSKYSRESVMQIGGKMEFVQEVQNFTLAIRELAKALRCIPGYKNIILFSTGVPNWLAYGNASDYSPQWDRFNLDRSNTLALRSGYERMSKELAAANSPVYAVNVEGLFADFLDRHTYKTDLLREIQGDAQISSKIKTRGKRGDTSLRNLAKATGGKYYDKSNAAEKIIEDIQSITSSYYVLGYYIDEKWDGRFHKIKVKVKRRDCKVNAQRGYFNPKPFAEFGAVEKKIHMVDLALSEKPYFGDPVRFPMATLYTESADNPMALLYFTFSAQRLKDVLGEKTEIAFLVFDEAQNIVGFRGVSLGGTELFNQKILPFCSFPLYHGRFQCRVIIRNMGTGQSAVASSPLVISQKSDEEMKLYPPLLLVPEGNRQYLNVGWSEESEGQAEYSDFLKFYSFDPEQYTPIAKEVDKRNPEILVLTAFSIPELPEAEVKLSARLVHQTSGEKVPLDFVFEERQGAFALRIPTSELLAGKYFLYIFAEETHSQSKSSTSATFELK